MKIAILSDAHGNWSAFQAACFKIQELQPDHWIFCGDICGYYYEQNEIIRQLSQLYPLTAVRGNHDEDFLKGLKDHTRLKASAERYGSGYLRLKDGIEATSLSFLEQLPLTAESPNKEWAVFHGSPWAPLTEYIYPDTPIDRFAALPYRYVFLGHTHYPMHRRAGNVQIINPGSCGQPRDERRPSFAMVDTTTDTVSFHRFDYDSSNLKSQIAKNDPALSYLRDVLDRSPSTRQVL